MLLSFIKAIVLITSLNVSAWQESLYSRLIKNIFSPLYPQTSLVQIDDNSLNFISYSAHYDPGDKYYFVMHDTTTVPTWFFIMRHDGKRKDELWHRALHNGVPCNILQGNKLLLHLKTVGFIKTDIIFRTYYEVQDTKYGVVAFINMDKTYPSEKVEDFKMVVWAFPHPLVKNLVIVVAQGYIKSSYSMSLINNHIRWHVDSVLQNFGERLLSVMK